MSELSAKTARSPWGIQIVESPLLPMRPSDVTVARRIVRHGLANVLAWLGQDVGPKPGDQTQALMIGNTLHANLAIVGALRNSPGTSSPEE